MHAITEFDHGFVLGTTWHKHPNYICQDMPVSIEQATTVLDYPMDLRPNFRVKPLADGTSVFEEVAGSFYVVRPDHDIVLTPFVGGRYQVLSNKALIDHVSENVLEQHPDLRIESVGTLFSGKVAFVNLVVKEFDVDGDNSKSQHRMMYYNPIGLGAYRVCCHTTRIVCNNTLQIAAAQGAANQTMHKISHTKSAGARIAGRMTDLANVYLGLEDFETQVKNLAHAKMTAAQIEKFFKHVFKLDEAKAGISIARAQSKYDQVMAVLESDSTIDKRSAWGVLNAYTNVVDHTAARDTQDAMAITWDALVGDRAKAKSTVLGQLSAFVKVA